MDFTMTGLLTFFSKSLTTGIVFPSLILLGCYLTWKLRGLQVTKFSRGFARLFESAEKNGHSEGTMSRYQAVATVVASGFGTGNISGMAVAIATGGPGALFWMWIMAFLGSIVQFANTVLGIKYRQKNSDGEYVGGPMYYLKNGLGWKKMATLFSLLVIFVAFTSGNFCQVNSIALPLTSLGISPWFSGILLAVVGGFVVLGGAMRIAVVAGVLVPLMALFYIGGAIAALFICHDQLLPSIELIFKSALGFGPAVGGVLGYGVMQAVIFGFNRAIFATDAGTGIAPLLQSGARSRHPVIDGIATLVAPFMVMVVCTVTFLVLMSTGAYIQPNLQSTNMVLFGFSKTLGHWGEAIVCIALFLFAYTTLITMAACMDRAVEYLFGRRWVKSFRWFYIVMIPVGALLHVSLVWVIADIGMTSMLVINVFGTAMLSKEVIEDHNQFFAKEKPLESIPSEEETIPG